MLYKFTDVCLIGIKELDEDHRKLFELINQVVELLDNHFISDKYHQIKEVLDELEEYADSHFIREEAYMAAINDPELEMQKKQHMAFREKMNDMAMHDIDEIEQQEEALRDLMEYLTKWLYSHIINSDILIGKMPPLKAWIDKENPCEFTEEYKTGIVLIDTEHEVLFDIIRETSRLVQDDSCVDKYDKIVEIIQKLKDYTAEHFRDEEEYMESIGYAGLDAQKMAHRNFISKLNDINLEQMDKEQQEYLKDLMEFLFAWLSNHILKSDKMIVDQ